MREKKEEGKRAKGAKAAIERDIYRHDDPIRLQNHGTEAPEMHREGKRARGEW